MKFFVKNLWVPLVLYLHENTGEAINQIWRKKQTKKTFLDPFSPNEPRFGQITFNCIQYTALLNNIGLWTLNTNQENQMKGFFLKKQKDRFCLHAGLFCNNFGQFFPKKKNILKLFWVFRFPYLNAND